MFITYIVLNFVLFIAGLLRLYYEGEDLTLGYLLTLMFLSFTPVLNLVLAFVLVGYLIDVISESILTSGSIPNRTVDWIFNNVDNLLNIVLLKGKSK